LEFGLIDEQQRKSAVLIGGTAAARIIVSRETSAAASRRGEEWDEGAASWRERERKRVQQHAYGAQSAIS